MTDVVAIYNESKFAPNDFTATAIEEMVAACQIQLDRDVPEISSAMPVKLLIVECAAAVPAGAIPCPMHDGAPEQGVLGDHWAKGGQPKLEVFVKEILSNGGTIKDGSNSISACLSHELLETQGSKGANGYKDDGKGVLHSDERVDAIEDLVYVINTVTVSGFLGDNWFVPDAKTDLDILGFCKEAFQRSPNGYESLATAPNDVHDADRIAARAKERGFLIAMPRLRHWVEHPETWPDWKRALKFRHHGRIHQRMLRLT